VNVVGFLALFVLVNKQLPFFKMSYLFVYMKLESLPPPALHCTLTEFNPVQFSQLISLQFFSILFSTISV
jgi:hypothetical protein